MSFAEISCNNIWWNKSELREGSRIQASCYSWYYIYLKHFIQISISLELWLQGALLICPNLISDKKIIKKCVVQEICSQYMSHAKHTIKSNHVKMIVNITYAWAVSMQVTHLILLSLPAFHGNVFFPQEAQISLRWI